MRPLLVLWILWAGIFVAAAPQPGVAPVPDHKPISSYRTTSTKKLTTSTKKTSTSTKKPSSTAKSTSTKKTSSSTKISTSTKSSSKAPTSSAKTSSTKAPSTSTPKVSSISPSSTSSVLTLPSVTLPVSPSVTLPSVTLPSVSLPSVSLPSVSLPESPSVTLPSVTLPVSPSVTVPSVEPTISTPVDPGCGIRAGNLLPNGGFGNPTLDPWVLGTGSFAGTCSTQVDPNAGAVADLGNTNAFEVQITAANTDWIISLSQTICLVPNAQYSLSAMSGVNGLGGTSGDTFCSFQANVDGLVVVRTRAACGGVNVPADYGTCVTPNPNNPNIRYETLTGTFTTGAAPQGRVELRYYCSDNGGNVTPPAAVVDNIILLGP